MEEIHKLRAQLSRIVEANFPGTDVGITAKLQPPNDLQVELLFPLRFQAKELIKDSAQGAQTATHGRLH